MEIEKKYRVGKLPNNLDTYKKKEIEQGYLCTEPVVRIRKSNCSYIFTFKAPKEEENPLFNKESVAIVNQEIEMPITKEAYEHLRTKVDDFLIRKTRYLIPLEDNLIGELDIFHDQLEGLYFIEVEFQSEEEAKSFKPPTWFSKEVTFDKRFRNNYLNKIRSLEELQLDE